MEYKLDPENGKRPNLKGISNSNLYIAKRVIRNSHPDVRLIRSNIKQNSTASLSNINRHLNSVLSLFSNNNQVAALYSSFLKNDDAIPHSLLHLDKGVGFEPGSDSLKSR